MSQHDRKNSMLHHAPTGFNVKQHIISLEDRMQLVLFGVVGVLLIAFPETLRKAVPYMVGIALLVYGLICLIICIRQRDREADLGFDVIYVILGSAILYYNENSLGAIGCIWALFTLTEVAEEINESYHHKRRISPLMLLIDIASVALAILLMFDPVEHFAFHVRILGIEMILSIFARWGVKKDKEEDKLDEEFADQWDFEREMEEELETELEQEQMSNQPPEE